jgi:hypothetical protein
LLSLCLWQRWFCPLLPVDAAVNEDRGTEFYCPDCSLTFSNPIPIREIDTGHRCKKTRRFSALRIVEGNSCIAAEEAVPSPETEHNAQKSREEPMATKRAEPTKEAKVAKASAVAEENSEKKGRRSFGHRGWLAEEVEKILRKDRDRQVAVSALVAEITNSQGENPSSGAVAAVLKRWNEQGYVKLTSGRPMSFAGYMARWKDSSLEAFLASEKSKRDKARAAAKDE